MKTDRRRDLLKILREGQPSSQREIVMSLRALGHEVTQATVSRDLREVGAVKVRLGDDLVYRLPDAVPRSPVADLMARGLVRTLAEFAVDVRPAGSLVVITTAPGHANAVARGIDFAGLESVVGTIAGDDTIFVATPGAEEAERLSAHWTRGMSAAKAVVPSGAVGT